MRQIPGRTGKAIFFGFGANRRMSPFLRRVLRIRQLREQHRAERHAHAVLTLVIGAPLVPGRRQDQLFAADLDSGSSFLYWGQLAASLGALHDLDRHPEVDQPRLQQRQREFVFCVDPTVVAAGMVVALMKFQERPAGRAKFGPEIGLAEEPKCFGARIVLTLPVFRPVAFTTGLSKSSGPISWMSQILSISFSVLCGMPWSMKNLRHVGAGGGSIVHSPSVSV